MGSGPSHPDPHSNLEVITNPYTLAGRVVLFFKCAVGPGLHTERSDVRNLAFVEEYWRLPPKSGDPLCSEFQSWMCQVVFHHSQGILRH